MNSLLEALLTLEKRLLALGPECPKPCAEALLASEFREFGGSGRVLSRKQALDEIADAPTRAYAVSSVQMEALSAEAALLTYRVV